ncbi:MAG: type I-E CRISPR-associated protein Cas5/CasD [Ferrimonas sp.]
MTQANRYLLLWLEGPLQSWGHDARFGVRETLHFPTRSGVLGLLCCARGVAGTEQQWLQQMAPMLMEVQAFLPNTSMALSPPILRDFQMVGSGYNAADPWQSLLIPKTELGKKAVGGGTKMTYRDYLQDHAFAVALEIPVKQEEMLIAALQQPIWDLYLGRKNCVPTELIYQGVYPTLNQAWQCAHQLAKQKQRALSYVVREGQHEGGEILTLNDVPLQFGEQKRYQERQVTILDVE